MYLQFIRKLTKYLHKTTSAGRFVPVQQQTTLTCVRAVLFANFQCVATFSRVCNTYAGRAGRQHITSHTTRSLCQCIGSHNSIFISYTLHDCSCGQVEPVLRHVMCCLPPIVVVFVVVVVFAKLTPSG